MDEQTTSTTSISGGGVNHLKSVIREKKKRGELPGKVRKIFVVIGGNNFGRRDEENGGAKVVMSRKELEEMMTNFIRWILAELPSIVIHTMDILPRKSVKASFISGVRNWAGAVKCQDTLRHRHLSCLQVFSLQKRGYSGKGGKAKQAKEEGRITRFDIRQEMYGNDGVHLSEVGKEVFIRMLSWMKSNDKGEFETEILPGAGEGHPIKLKAKYKF